MKVSKNGEFGTKDSYSTTLTQTFTRTEIAEVYRQMSWQACQAWAQGVYSDDHYAEKLDALLASGMKVIETRAAQPLTAPAKVEPDAAKEATEKAAKEAADKEKAKKAKAALCKKTPEAADCKQAEAPPV